MKHPLFYEMYKRDKRIMFFSKNLTPFKSSTQNKMPSFPYINKAKDAEFQNCVPIAIFKENRKRVKMKIKNTSVFYKILLNKKQMKK